MRNTRQRKLILDIVNNSFSHPTAYDIYELCKKEISDISLGTVYRNLNILSRNLEIKRLKMPDNIDRYDKNLKHSHFVCVKCLKIVDIHNKYLEEINFIDGNEILDCEIKFKGICKKCKEKGIEN